MKKQLKRAIFCAICMVVVGVMCLTGVTYAWFTESDSAVVDGIGIDAVTAVGGILISTDSHGGAQGTEWSYQLNLGVDVNEFEPASTHPSTLEGGKLKFFYAENDPANPYTQIKTHAVTSSEVNVNAGRYIEKTIYLNNASGAAPTTVSLAGTTVGTNNDKLLNYATRVAIVNHGSYTLGANQGETKTAADAVNAGADANKVQIYENDAKKSYSGADRDAALPTYGVCGADTSAFFPMNAERENVIAVTENKTDAANVTITVPAGQCQKITVYIWIEGQDVDCVNETSGAELSAKIYFTLTNTAQ